MDKHTGLARPWRTVLAVFALSSIGLSRPADASLTGLKIGLDPGHGGSNAGALGANGLTEKAVNLQTSAWTAYYVLLDGGEVYQTRTTDVLVVSLPSRTDYWNSNGIDRGVSIHHNSSSDSAVNRTMDFVYCGTCLGDPGTLATDIINRVSVSTGLIRGPAASTADTLCPGRTDWTCGFAGVGQADLHMVREVIAHHAALVEVSFISNPAEATKLLDDEYARSNGWAIYAGIAALGREPLPKDASPPPTSTPTQTQTPPTPATSTPTQTLTPTQSQQHPKPRRPRLPVSVTATAGAMSL